MKYYLRNWKWNYSVNNKLAKSMVKISLRIEEKNGYIEI